VNGNFISGFENGVNLSALPAEGCVWTGTRYDFNDIRDCNTGIRVAGTGFFVKLAIMENSITAGRTYPATPPCGDFIRSNGIWMNDTYMTDVVSNRIAGVDVGIHVSYHSCWTRVKKNQVTTNPGAESKAILVCPTHCNWLIENELSAPGTVGNPSAAAPQPKRRIDAPCLRSRTSTVDS
jgi:hypothetical protein